MRSGLEPTGGVLADLPKLASKIRRGHHVISAFPFHISVQFLQLPVADATLHELRVLPLSGSFLVDLA